MRNSRFHCINAGGLYGSRLAPIFQVERVAPAYLEASEVRIAPNVQFMFAIAVDLARYRAPSAPSVHISSE